MIKHIVSWNYKEGLLKEENYNIAKKVKTDLEALKDKIEGIKFLEVIIDPIESCTADFILVSEFESMKELNYYQGHEEHIKVGKFIRENLTNRQCIDYEF